MKKKIINGLLFAVALVAATSSFVSCKDAYDKQVQAMQDYVLTTRYNAETGYSAAELYAKGTIKARLDALEEDTASLAARILANNQAIQTANGLITDLRTDLTTAQGDITDLQADVTTLQGDLTTLNSTVVTLSNTVTDLTNRIVTIETDRAKWDEIANYVDGEKVDWERIKALVNDNNENWTEAYTLITEFLNGWDGVNSDPNKKTLKDLVDYLEANDAELSEKVAELSEKLDDIIKAMKTEITGITIQAAVNPIFGTFAYPVDVQSNILAAYYGTVTTQAVKFPTSDSSIEEDFWVWKKSPITKDELEAVFSGPYFIRKKGDLLVDADEDHHVSAGVVYLTVNPSNIDFTDNHNFSLRSSDNQLSKVKLSELKPCTEQLKWGYKRAIENSSNGFYSAEAYIDSAQVKDVALSFKVSNLASTIEAMMNDWSKVRAADVAKLGYSILTGLQADAPRLGVQAQWKDEVSGWQNWVSKYDLAAVSVNPLGFDFLTKENNAGDVEYMDFSPAIVKLQSKIDAKIKAFDMELQQMIAIQLGLDTSKLQNLDFKFDQVTNTINVYDQYGNYVGYADLSTFLGEMKDNTDSAVDGLNKFVGSVAGMQDNIDSQLATIKTKIHNYLTSFMNGIDKVFNKAASFASHPNRFIQPALFATADGKDVFHISRTHFAPTQIKKGTKLMIFPTTLTGEVVAPAFKKYIAVVDAWKFDANYNPTEAVANKFNTGAMNQVLDGNTYNIQKPFEYTIDAPAGTVLEIIYECLGYNGKVAGKKYYIEVYE